MCCVLDNIWEPSRPSALPSGSFTHTGMILKQEECFFSLNLTKLYFISSIQGGGNVQI